MIDLLEMILMLNKNLILLITVIIIGAFFACNNYRSSSYHFFDLSSGKITLYVKKAKPFEFLDTSRFTEDNIKNSYLESQIYKFDSSAIFLNYDSIKGITTILPLNTITVDSVLKLNQETKYSMAVQSYYDLFISKDSTIKWIKPKACLTLFHKSGERLAVRCSRRKNIKFDADDLEQQVNDIYIDLFSGFSNNPYKLKDKGDYRIVGRIGFKGTSDSVNTKKVVIYRDGNRFYGSGIRGHVILNMRNLYPLKLRSYIKYNSTYDSLTYYTHYYGTSEYKLLPNQVNIFEWKYPGELIKQDKLPFNINNFSRSDSIRFIY